MHTNIPAIHVLRGLLRHIKGAPSGPSSNSTVAYQKKNPLIQRVLSEYREAKTASKEQSDLLRKMAYDILSLKKDLKERGRLHELDGGAEIKLTPKELSRRAAARAGLSLPTNTYNE